MEKQNKVLIEEIEGVEGNCLSINNHRVAGNKPWGGGTVIKSWEISLKDLLNAVPELKKSISPPKPKGKLGIRKGGLYERRN